MKKTIHVKMIKKYLVSLEMQCNVTWGKRNLNKKGPEIECSRFDDIILDIIKYHVKVYFINILYIFHCRITDHIQYWYIMFWVCSLPVTFRIDMDTYQYSFCDIPGIQVWVIEFLLPFFSYFDIKPYYTIMLWFHHLWHS